MTSIQPKRCSCELVLISRAPQNPRVLPHPGPLPPGEGESIDPIGLVQVTAAILCSGGIQFQKAKSTAGHNNETTRARGYASCARSLFRKVVMKPGPCTVPVFLVR